MLAEAPRNGLAIHLTNGMPHGNHIAARKFCGTAGRVLVEFCLVNPLQESGLFS